MNPLNPWVAFTEIVLLLAISFVAGYTVSYMLARPRLYRLEASIRRVKKQLADPESMN